MKTENQLSKIKPADRLASVSEYYFSKKLKEVAQMNAEGKDVISLDAPKSYPRRNILPVCCHVYSLHADSLETGAGDHRKIIGRD